MEENQSFSQDPQPNGQDRPRPEESKPQQQGGHSEPREGAAQSSGQPQGGGNPQRGDNRGGGRRRGRRGRRGRGGRGNENRQGGGQQQGQGGSQSQPGGHSSRGGSPSQGGQRGAGHGGGHHGGSSQDGADRGGAERDYGASEEAREDSSSHEASEADTRLPVDESYLEELDQEAAPAEGEASKGDSQDHLADERRGDFRRGDERRNRHERGRSGGRDRGRDRGGRDRHDRGERDGGRRDSRREARSGGATKFPGKREILANTSLDETRVAISENGRLVELLWERRASHSIVGNIYKGRIENVLPGISSAFINIGFDKNAYLYISDVLGDTRKPIDQLLKKGQEVMIQVAKEAIGTKGMKVTMEVSMPGRYLVLSPFTQSVGISKHIEDPVERRRISDIVQSISAELLNGLGLVVRTEAEGASEEELRREAKFLVDSWKEVQRKFDTMPSPAALHTEMDLPMQVARDLLSEDVYVYLIDNKEIFESVVAFIDRISPELKNRVRHYDAKTPIFTAFNIEPEIEKLRQTKVSLPSGGTIVIQEAESLCAIDVNTGRFTGSKTQEETVTLNNIEAAKEVAHQLRLRNIGGIIVVDFIDMRKASNRQKVMEAFQDAVRHDRAKIRILPITRLGLIEMTRERRRESTISLMTDECPECRGSGRVLSAESMRVRVQREIFELTQGRPGGSIRLVLHPQLAEAFLEKQPAIEKNVGRGVKIVGDANLQWEDYRIILE